jgi:hypothetical protein
MEPLIERLRHLVDVNCRALIDDDRSSPGIPVVNRKVS